MQACNILEIIVCRRAISYNESQRMFDE